MDNIYNNIIIGAGIAGITYAYKHKTDNFLILEKNDYIGGRIKNINWYNKIISLGAGVLLPSHKNTLELCKKFNLDIHEYTSIYHLTDLQGDEPNNPLYYDNFKNIYKFVKNKYNIHKSEIKTNKLSFKEFLELYFPYKVSNTILDNSLYSTNFNSDPELFLNNEFLYDCFRIEDTKMMFIKNSLIKNNSDSGYDFLINKLLENIIIKNIILNTNVIEINQKNEFYEVITNDNIFTTKKIVLATDINSNIKFNLSNDIQKLLNHIYNSIGSVPYIRIYSYHKEGHNLKNSCKTRGLIGKTIIIDDNFLMLCYNESNHALNLNNLLSKLDKVGQIDALYKLFINHNINITKPHDIFIQYWNVGMHYCKPNFNIENELEILKTKYNIVIIGELVSTSHGWVNSALNTIN
jgi:hypothetical protein